MKKALKGVAPLFFIVPFLIGFGVLVFQGSAEKSADNDFLAEVQDTLKELTDFKHSQSFLVALNDQKGNGHGVVIQQVRLVDDKYPDAIRLYGFSTGQICQRVLKGIFTNVDYQGYWAAFGSDESIAWEKDSKALMDMSMSDIKDECGPEAVGGNRGKIFLIPPETMAQIKNEQKMT